MDTNRIQIHQLQDFLPSPEVQEALTCFVILSLFISPFPRPGNRISLIPWAGQGPDCKTEIQMGTPTVLRHGWVQPQPGRRRARERGREREAHANRNPPRSDAGLRPRPSAAAPAAVPAPSSPSPCPPGFACQVRVGTAPPAAPNKAVTHPRAGADSKQSDRRIFRMLIQTARRRTSSGGPPLPCTHTPPPPPTHAPHPWHPTAPVASCRDGEAPAGGSTEASSSARFKSSRSPARRANEATRHLLYLFPLPSSRLGTVTRAHSPLVGSQSRGSVTLCRKLAPIPAPELFQSTSGRRAHSPESLRAAKSIATGKKGSERGRARQSPHNRAARRARRN
ncbi:vegetative cell wall protein gp1-like [Corapipo altera]|uniref:vegetative cell wall protein gp1-like n=1 Tax=Corapipo altera TaxID=415028 RepID=UPI000FD6953C|nr:vegetative cell wall protein gp1-like [Corapipo altera]